jgi:hypothetical protein
MPATEYKDVRDNDWQALREQLRRFFQRLDKLEGHGGLSVRYAQLDMDGNLISGGPNPQSVAALTDYITKGYLQSDEGAQFLYLLTKTLGKASTGTSKTAVAGIAMRIDNFSQRGPAGSSSGQYFIAMDRGYVAWVSDGSYWRFVYGTQRGTIAPDQRPTGLTTYDLGYRFHSTDTDQIYVWTGSTWAYDIPDATTSVRGLVSTGTQSVAGDKTFTGSVGVGASPSFKLDVNQSGGGVPLRVVAASVTAGTRMDSAAGSPPENRNWFVGSNKDIYGDFVIRTSSALGGDPIASGVNRIYIDPSGNITFPVMGTAGYLKNTAAGLLSGGNKVVESDLNLTNVTTADVSITAHGLVPRAPNDTKQFLRGDAGWAVPPVQTPGANGENCEMLTSTVAVNGLSGATATASNFIPAGSLVLGITLRVTTLITSGAGTSFKIGDGTTTDAWGATVAFAAGTATSIANFTVVSPKYYAAATNVVLTCNGGTFTAGAVRLSISYIKLTPPTS